MHRGPRRYSEALDGLLSAKIRLERLEEVKNAVGFGVVWVFVSSDCDGGYAMRPLSEALSLLQCTVKELEDEAVRLKRTEKTAANG